MAYKYREVLCPLCGHKFMWGDTTREGTSNEYYRIKETGEIAGRAKCTVCATYLAVFTGQLEGVLPGEREDLVYVRELGI